MVHGTWIATLIPSGPDPTRLAASSYVLRVCQTKTFTAVLVRTWYE